MGKTEKAKYVAKESAREKTESMPQSLRIRTESAAKSIFLPYRKQKKLADAQYKEKHDIYTPSSEMTVDAWFEFWITNLIADLSPNTKCNYRERYQRNIQPDVGTIFRAAVMNDMITKHPMDGVRYTKPVRAVKDIKFLTVEEQEALLETAKRSHNYRQCVLLLETGLRTSELIGLTWDAIGWKIRTLTVSKTLEYRHKDSFLRAGPPKTTTRYRTIPLTNQACNVLKECYDERHTRKPSH